MVKAAHTMAKAKPGNTLLKAMVRYCFIFLFTFIFATLKFSAFLYASRPAVLIKGHSISYSLPAGALRCTDEYPSYPGEPDMEIVQEDEETEVKTGQIDEPFYISYKWDQQLNYSFLKSWYLYKEYALHNRHKIPFFVLYHSWKSYLC